MKRPDFDTFRSMFLESLANLTGWPPSHLPGEAWAEMGGEEIRVKVLTNVNLALKNDFGVEFEVNQRLINLEGPVESVIIQAFHELNTIFLMERIYARIRSSQN